MELPTWITRRAKHLVSGRKAERKARLFLERRGLRTITRNYRCRGGEIDLIMRDRDQLVFVEVRYRASARFGTPEETVDGAKQSRLRSCADLFVARRSRYRSVPCRFDIVALCGPWPSPELRWLRDAF